jgi:NAD(P)-dependent dehydrogenase (short-subunit alcohol dehydrogenase family)
VALVTGASAGIGLALCRQLLGNAHVACVLAVSRSACDAASLDDLQRIHGERLQRVGADLSTDPGIAAVAHAAQRLGSVDLVLSAAGLLHDARIAPEKAIEQVTRAALERSFALNAFAPVLLARALMPWLCGGTPAVFASLSARVGSIGDNRAGGWYAYRAAKAAQNQLLRTFSIEWRRRNPRGTCLILHPGTVETALSEPFRSRVPAERLSTPDAAAARLLRLVSRATPADTGRFMAWDGEEVPW